MGNTILRIVSCISCSAALFAATNKLLGAMAQGGYDGGKFKRWLFRKDNLYYGRLCLLSLLCLLSSAVVALAFSFSGATVSRALSAIPYLLFLILFVVADKKYALKVPMKRTARVKRLAILYLFLTLVFSYAILAALYFFERLVGKDLYTLFAYAPYCFMPLAEPFILILSNAILSPFEKKRNTRFVLAEKEKLDNMPILRIAVTGSYGKTSVKNVLKTMLGEKYAVAATPESYNTPVGIAKTVQSGEIDGKDIFIAEAGARKRGDIRELCSIIRPDYGVLTGVCAQHIQSFGSLEEAEKEKSELVFAAQKAVFCGEEFYEKAKNSAYLDGVKEKCFPPCKAENIDLYFDHTEFDLVLDGEPVRIRTSLLGKSGVENIALSAAVCLALGLSKEEIVRGASKVQSVPHRLQLTQSGGVYILDDGYNASEKSAKEAIAALLRHDGKKVVVTPGIVEGGVLESDLNENLGKELAAVDYVVLIGETLVRAVKTGYLSAGGKEENIVIVPTLDQAKTVLAERLDEGDCVLFLNDLPDVY